MQHAADGQERQVNEKVFHLDFWVPANHNTWNGCITDRDKDFDTKNTTPNPADASLSPGQASTMFPAEQANDCPAKMMGLSYDWTALKNKVDESWQPKAPPISRSAWPGLGWRSLRASR